MTDDDATVIRRPQSVAEGADQMNTCLIVLSGQAVGRMFKLQGNKSTIGRAEDADIQLDDEGVSRYHAKIVALGPGVLTIKDLGSTNGTFVNGDRIKSHVLTDGDRIQIGSTTILKFSVHDSLEEQFQQQLYDSATRDPLTQVQNKRFFEEHLNKNFSHAKRHGTSLSVLALDIDHFKSINDTHGHLAGDKVLRHLSAAMTGSVRNEDMVCRIGGEEFAIIARDTDIHSAVVLAERLRSTVAHKSFDYEGTRIPVTVSVGVACYDPSRHEVASILFAEADDRLYEAKRSGRNCIRPPLEQR